jgi:hypothetical protein
VCRGDGPAYLAALAAVLGGWLPVRWWWVSVLCHRRPALCPAAHCPHTLSPTAWSGAARRGGGRGQVPAPNERALAAQRSEIALRGLLPQRRRRDAARHALGHETCPRKRPGLVGRSICPCTPATPATPRRSLHRRNDLRAVRHRSLRVAALAVGRGDDRGRPAPAHLRSRQARAACARRRPPAVAADRARDLGRRGALGARARQPPARLARHVGRDEPGLFAANVDRNSHFGRFRDGLRPEPPFERGGKAAILRRLTMRTMGILLALAFALGAGACSGDNDAPGARGTSAATQASSPSTTTFR